MSHFASRGTAGHRRTGWQRNQLGRPCAQSHWDYSPIRLSSYISAYTVLLSSFLLFLLFFLSCSPSLMHTICACPPPHPTLPLVSPLHLLSTPPVSLLAALHWDHTAAEVRRLTQWSVIHRRAYTPIATASSHLFLPIILPPAFSHPFPIISLEFSQIGLNQPD